MEASKTKNQTKQYQHGVHVRDLEAALGAHLTKKRFNMGAGDADFERAKGGRFSAWDFPSCRPGLEGLGAVGTHRCNVENMGEYLSKGRGGVWCSATACRHPGNPGVTRVRPRVKNPGSRYRPRHPKPVSGWGGRTSTRCLTLLTCTRSQSNAIHVYTQSVKCSQSLEHHRL